MGDKQEEGIGSSAETKQESPVTDSGPMENGAQEDPEPQGNEIKEGEAVNVVAQEEDEDDEATETQPLTSGGVETDIKQATEEETLTESVDKVKESDPKSFDEGLTKEGGETPAGDDMELENKRHSKTDDESGKEISEDLASHPVPTTSNQTDVEKGQPISAGANDSKTAEDKHLVFLHFLKKKEVVFCCIGGITFLIGLIMIIVGLMVMQGKCDRHYWVSAIIL